MLKNRKLEISNYSSILNGKQGKEKKVSFLDLIVFVIFTSQRVNICLYIIGKKCLHISLKILTEGTPTIHYCNFNLDCVIQFFLTLIFYWSNLIR